MRAHRRNNNIPLWHRVIALIIFLCIVPEAVLAGCIVTTTTTTVAGVTTTTNTGSYDSTSGTTFQDFGGGSLSVTDPKNCSIIDSTTGLVVDSWGSMISGTICIVQSIIASSMFNVYCSLVTAWKPIVEKAMILYIIFFAIAFMFEIGQVTIKQTIVRLIKMSLIYTMATNPEMFYIYIYQFFLNFLDGFSATLTTVLADRSVDQLGRPVFTNGARIYDAVPYDFSSPPKLLPRIEVDDAGMKIYSYTSSSGTFTRLGGGCTVAPTTTSPGPITGTTPGCMSPANTGGVFNIYDKMFEILVGKETTFGLLMLALVFFVFGVTIPISLLIMGGIVASILMFFRIIISYLSAVVFLSFTMMFAPIFISFLLFKESAKLFKSWLGSIISYAMQPVIVLVFLYMMGEATSFGSLISGMTSDGAGDSIMLPACEKDPTHFDSFTKADLGLMLLEVGSIPPKYVFNVNPSPPICNGFSVKPPLMEAWYFNWPDFKPPLMDTSTPPVCIKYCTTLWEKFSYLIAFVFAWYTMSVLTTAFLLRVPDLAKRVAAWSNYTSAPVITGKSATASAASSFHSGSGGKRRGADGSSPYGSADVYTLEGTLMGAGGVLRGAARRVGNRFDPARALEKKMAKGIRREKRIAKSLLHEKNPLRVKKLQEQLRSVQKKNKLMAEGKDDLSKRVNYDKQKQSRFGNFVQDTVLYGAIGAWGRRGYVQRYAPNTGVNPVVESFKKRRSREDAEIKNKRKAGGAGSAEKVNRKIAEKSAARKAGRTAATFLAGKAISKVDKAAAIKSAKRKAAKEAKKDLSQRKKAGISRHITNERGSVKLPFAAQNVSKESPTMPSAKEEKGLMTKAIHLSGNGAAGFVRIIGSIMATIPVIGDFVEVPTEMLGGIIRSGSRKITGHKREAEIEASIAAGRIAVSFIPMSIGTVAAKEAAEFAIRQGYEMTEKKDVGKSTDDKNSTSKTEKEDSKATRAKSKKLKKIEALMTKEAKLKLAIGITMAASDKAVDKHSENFAKAIQNKYTGTKIGDIDKELGRLEKSVLMMEVETANYKKTVQQIKNEVVEFKIDHGQTEDRIIKLENKRDTIDEKIKQLMGGSSGLNKASLDKEIIKLQKQRSTLGKKINENKDLLKEIVIYVTALEKVQNDKENGRDPLHRKKISSNIADYSDRNNEHSMNRAAKKTVSVAAEAVTLSGVDKRVKSEKLGKMEDMIIEEARLKLAAGTTSTMSPEDIQRIRDYAKNVKNKYSAATINDIDKEIAKLERSCEHKEIDVDRQYRQKALQKKIAKSHKKTSQQLSEEIAVVEDDKTYADRHLKKLDKKYDAIGGQIKKLEGKASSSNADRVNKKIEKLQKQRDELEKELIYAQDDAAELKEYLAALDRIQSGR